VFVFEFEFVFVFVFEFEFVFVGACSVRGDAESKLCPLGFR
jgi:hypothetical protein